LAADPIVPPLIIIKDRQPQQRRGVNGNRKKRRDIITLQEKRPGLVNKSIWPLKKKKGIKRQPPNDVLAYDAPLTPV
jgi:hypothetical protein